MGEGFLTVGSVTRSIVGLKLEESDALLKFLKDHIAQFTPQAEVPYETLYVPQPEKVEKKRVQKPDDAPSEVPIGTAALCRYLQRKVHRQFEPNSLQPVRVVQKKRACNLKGGG
jgi:predicted GTPase